MEHKKRFERRQFLKLGLAGVSGAALLSPFQLKSENSKRKGKVIYRTLGKTGVQLPIVSMGSMRGENMSLIEEAIKKGIRHFDTANSYQNGKNEELLGQVLKKYKRKNYFIATKIIPDDMDRQTGELGPGSTAELFLKKLDTSLARLQMSQVDLLYIHALSTRSAVLNKEMIKAVTTAKKLGKTRFVGVSTHRNEPEVLDAMIEAGIYDVALVAYNFKQDHRDQLKLNIQKAADAGIGIIAMKTMAGGFIDKEKTKPINTKAALKWVLQDKNVCTSIPGFTSFNQLEESFGVMEDLELSDAEKHDLESASHQAGLYCNQCGICLEQCKKSLPVNDLMRAYMYAYGYRDAFKAKELITSANLGQDPCLGCDGCTVDCPKGFNVHLKIADVSRVVSIPDDFIA